MQLIKKTKRKKKDVRNLIVVPAKNWCIVKKFKTYAYYSRKEIPIQMCI